MVKALLAIVFGLLLVAPVFAAAPLQPKTTAAQAKPAKPDWSELTPAQRDVLAPLQPDWSGFDTPRRTKWVKVANNYPKMKTEQQHRLQTQMKHWVALTPEERRAAREKYKTLRKLPAAEREQVKAQWQQYQQSLSAPADANAPEAAGPTPQ